MKDVKRLVRIDNDKFIFNILWSLKEWTWKVKSAQHDETIHLPLAIAKSELCGFPVFRIIVFKLMIELAIKRHA
jgi:hypothetical protein